jgi:hypothetical protein
VKHLDELNRESLTELVVKLQQAMEMLGQTIKEQEQTIAEQHEQIALLAAEVERLRRSGCDGNHAPAFVKPTRKKKPADKKPRKKRSQSFVRRRMQPTRQKVHALDDCPDCGHKLEGGRVKRTREVIEIPPVVPVVTEHLFMGRFCCQRRLKCLQYA